ncbi:AAA family ATPase [Clostridium tyrobutyricum]|uniref:Adenylate kinase n=1 Tax=Clostridium tyrobutyricum DIVETGP TaxID=1408889 RepID=W6N7Z4_CLOTY|nr:ATP-binding protein [Clostridium tyrobutyricum]AND85553.1 hypothetical protein CTK_C23050 [Clostridium tyrobutyricum]ANP70084.1 hypothetical protein BA182_10435 [Clostridium tyrobutyricum]MBV4434429.1 AAA family ATPase [Clostridium tyrobutyricum]QNB65556.1 AAA family ATPase [Clostridium tyrobutyricum]CDL92455.1 hypothetical protein CTDIVETGP_2525 [Clostridium tyrobutyricum DIVETGP]
MNSDFDKKVIFVGGIHGVGKTTLCEEISKKISLKHYSASELISNLKSENITKNKEVSNVRENQNILLESVDRYLNNEEYYLLDGHFCLLNRDENIVEVPFNTFRLLGLKAIIVLVDHESQILKRLVDRDAKSYSIDFMKEFQKKEIYYAKEVAIRIGVRYKVINKTSDVNETLEFITSIINK